MSQDGSDIGPSSPATGAPDDPVASFRASISPNMPYTAATAAVRQLARLRGGGAMSPTKSRIAILGGTTTTQLANLVNVFLFAGQVDADFYEAPFGLIRQEILDPSSELYQFKPDFIFIASTRRDLLGAPDVSATEQEFQTAVETAAAGWEALWRTAHERLGCQIIQNNFDAPLWRAFGNLELSHPGAHGRFVDAVNRALRERAPRWVSIHDLDALAASVGRWNWGDDRFFHIAKLPCAPEHLPIYAHSVASLMLARLGRSRKCLVLDLDNTLWGGVVGDDGLGGIVVGQGDPVGEAYLAFQYYAKALAARGVILAVCSKNEEVNAKEVFEKHPDMVLRLPDISCFVANWDDKAGNLRRIAQELNIGLDALVFVDDNPAERALVRRLAPEVAVPELPEDPTDYIRAVEAHRYFEAVAISNEDFQRTEMYRANAQRRETASNIADLDDFLRSLAMRAWIGPIGDVELDRAVQLIGKSNQFNLTTRRHSAADIQRMIESPSWILRVVKLADAFGDNGLISVLLAEATDDALIIDTWLMSCRVLKRGVEQCLLNHVVAIARDRGLKQIIGDYIPTAKNGLVKEHYANLGFTQIDIAPDGATRWELAISDAWTGLPHHIREEHT
jgi:FkbH-like protein